MENYILKIENMSKSFPGVCALDNVKLFVKKGSVHALVGENGAGKSTLMKCIFGLYEADKGTIKIDGKNFSPSDSSDALRNGISMIHQELSVVPYRSVSDNIWAGRFITNGIIVDEKETEKRTKELLSNLEFNIDSNVLAKDLSVSELQALEIAKAVSYDAKVIIMDEPTSSLTVAETKHLFKIIKKLKDEGRSVIYISHRLEEFFEIVDEVSVMRDGKYIGTWDIKDVSVDKLIKLMVGRDMTERFPPSDKKPLDEIILSVKNFSSIYKSLFQDVSFDLRKGEILGIGGLVGAKRSELVEGIFGLRHIESGTLVKDGIEIKNRNPREAIGHGFALLTEERRATGIIPMLSIKDNALTAIYRKIANMFGIIKEKKSAILVDDVFNKLDVRASGMDTLIKNLSGGNQQKVLIGRWLLSRSNILILDEPTRGVDVGAKYEIYKIMREFVKSGNSIIMVSSEMPELLGMSDRILVMRAGRVSGILKKENATQVEVMRLATKFENTLEL